MTATARRRAVVRLLAGLAAAALVLLTAGCGIGGSSNKHLTAYFTRTVGVYVNSDVRVLGVAVGRVTAITPEGSSVRVDMQYDSKIKLPADAKAVVVAPSIVSDRYVQITPAYTGGAVLADGTSLDVSRTLVPLELDQIYAQIDKLNQALGPNGANKNGALSDLLTVSAQNLQGNGQLLGTTLADLSQAVQTLSQNRNDLFGTISNLQQFTTTIANSDATVRQFNADLADVANQLAGQRQDLATAVQQLAVALGEVSTFVRDNRDSLTTNVSQLAEVTKVLVNQKTALQEFLDTAPTALSNLQLAYNPASGTLDTRDNGASFTQAPGTIPALICAAIRSSPNSLNAINSMLPGALQPAANQLAQACTAVTAGSPPAAAGSSAPAATPPALGSLSVPWAVAAATAAPAPPTDTSLAGLLLGAP